MFACISYVILTPTLIMFASGEITCDSPSPIDYAEVNISGKGIGDTANYTCNDEFYFPSGASWIGSTCTFDGWTSIEGKCKGRLIR